MHTGIALAAFGFAGFAFQVRRNTLVRKNTLLTTCHQITFFKSILAKFRVKGTYSKGLIVSTLFTTAVPAAGSFYAAHGQTTATTVLTWIVVIITSCGAGIGFMLGLSVLGSMIANAADPSMFVCFRSVIWVCLTFIPLIDKD
jgi:hypothetical protein